MKNVSKYLERNASTILVILGSVGVVCTAISAVRATPKALQLIEESAAETKLEKFIVALPSYIPSLILGASTIGCIVSSQVVNKKIQNSLVGAYGLVDRTYKDYRSAAVRVYGTEGDTKILTEVLRNRNISQDGYAIYDPQSDIGSDRVLFYDSISDRYFTSTMAAVLSAQYAINRNLMLQGEASLNDFYDLLGLEEIEGGDAIGWGCEFFDSGLMWIDFDNKIVTLDDGLECCIIDSLWETEELHPYFK